jgi:hypothetical protein
MTAHSNGGVARARKPPRRPCRTGVTATLAAVLVIWPARSSPAAAPANADIALTSRPFESLAHPSPALSRDDAIADLDSLASHLNQRFSYLDRAGFDHAAALDSIRDALPESIRLDDFAMQLRRFIGRFGDGHASVEQPRREGAAEHLPFLLADTPEGLVAVRGDRSGFVDPDRPFVRSINGTATDEWLALAADLLATRGSPQLARLQAIDAIAHFRVLSLLAGAGDASHAFVELTSRDGDAIGLRVPLAAEPVRVRPWPRRDSAVLDGRIGYLRLDRMDDDAAAAVNEWMPRFARCDSVIIDVRGNGGGSREALLALWPFLAPDDAPRVVNVASYRLCADFPPDHLESRFLFPRDSSRWSEGEQGAIDALRGAFTPEWHPPAGRFSEWHYLVMGGTRDTDDLAAPADRFDGGVVVLMNERCFSATDIFLGAMDLLPNVTLLGRASAGGSGRVTEVTLPRSGLRVRLSSMASFRPDGRLYDGCGVEPDVVVHPVAADFLEHGTDTQLDAAIARLQAIAESDDP